MKYTFIDTCFQTHHLQFAYDKNDTLWTSSGGGTGVVGWLNLKMYEETGDAVRSQGWTPMILDTNGDGKRGEYTEPNQPLDPNKDRRYAQVFYAVMPSPADDSIWGTIRVQPRRGRAHRSRTEPDRDGADRDLQRADAGLRSARRRHRQPGRGLGVARAAATSARSTGASARVRSTGRRRPATTAPKAGRSTSTRARASRASARTAPSSSYYTWVDQHNTFGLGKDVPMSTANLMDGLVAYADGKMVSLRVPYPLGFYAKGFDGRIDDPKAGWKGRGLWTSSGDRTPWLIEGGKGMKPHGRALPAAAGSAGEVRRQVKSVQNCDGRALSRPSCFRRPSAAEVHTQCACVPRHLAYIALQQAAQCRGRRHRRRVFR